VITLLLRTLGGLLKTQLIKKKASPLSGDEWQYRLTSLARGSAVNGPVRLLLSSGVGVPTVLGWRRPAILLPSSVINGLTPQEVDARIAHELVHIRRRDYLFNLFQAVVEDLLFYHPGVWWVSSQVRAERECCCDNSAGALCSDTLTYARALSNAERLRSEPRVAVAASGAPLLIRIQRLTEMPTNRPGRAAALLMGFSAAGALLAAGAASSFLISAPADFRKPPSPSAIQQSGQDVNTIEQAGREANRGFRLAKLDLKDMTVFPREELLRQFSIKPGDAFDIAKVKESLDRILRLYADQGFAGCRFTPEMDRDPTQKTIALTFSFMEGLRYFVGRITFVGSSSPLTDKSLRKALSPFLEEGRIYRPSDVNLAIEAINNSGVFKNLTRADCQIDLKRDPFDPKAARVDITFRVKPNDDLEKKNSSQSRVAQQRVAGNVYDPTGALMPGVQITDVTVRLIFNMR